MNETIFKVLDSLEKRILNIDSLSFVRLKKTDEDGIQSYYHTKVISVHPENETTEKTVEKQSMLHHRAVNNDQTPTPT